MKTRHSLLLVVVLICISASAFAADYKPITPFLNQYCVSCHGPDEQEGGVRLDDINNIDGPLWIDIFDQIDLGEMPPRKADQPPKKLRTRINKLIEAVSYDDQHTISTGYRRLNKREYHNTVLDLSLIHISEPTRPY